MYEPYRRRSRRPARFGGRLLRLLLKLLIFLVALALLAGLVLYALPADVFSVEPAVDLGLSPGLPASPINVLLLGVDRENEGVRRSDSMLIASIGSGGVRLTSILRDTMVDIPGHGQGRINSAYAYGGAELALRTVNENFGLNIMHYVVADYVTLVRLVDALGGIEADITAAEMEQINANVYSMRRTFLALGYTCEPLTIPGEDTHLNGLQALAYARIRKLDSDFVRASRQRIVLAAMREKLKANLWNPVLLGRAGSAALSALDTDLNAAQLLSLGLKAAFGGELATLRLPVDGSFDDTGASIVLTDPELNRRALREFLYP